MHEFNKIEKRIFKILGDVPNKQLKKLVKLVNKTIKLDKLVQNVTIDFKGFHGHMPKAFPSEVFTTSELQPSTLSLSKKSWEASSTLFVPRTTGPNNRLLEFLTDIVIIALIIAL